MDFRYENEMAAPVRKWMEGQGLVVKPEFSTPWGICDLFGVLIDQDKAKIRQDWGQKQRLGSILRTSILDSIPETKAITKQTLARRFDSFLSMDDLDREIDILIKRKFVRSPRKNQLQKDNGWMPLQKRIVAVELKLSRIEDVIFQARNHRQVTNESYIALPLDIAERLVGSTRIGRIMEYGIGVLGVSAQSCKELVKPNIESSQIDNVLQAGIVERFW